MSRVFTCRGCGSTGFTWRGYAVHVRHSHDDLCRQSYALEHGLSNDSDESDESDNATAPYQIDDNEDQAHLGPFNIATEPTHFAGDALGSAEDYALDGFGQEMDVDGSTLGGVDGSEAGDDDEAIERVMNSQLENGWEPERPNTVHDPAASVREDREDRAHEVPDDLDAQHAAQELRQDRAAAEGHLIGKEGHGPKPAAIQRFTDKYPTSQCGQPLTHLEGVDSRYESRVEGRNNPWAPFQSKLEWEVSRWAKLRGPSSTAFSELLAIEGVSEALNLTYKTSDGLNKIIDDKLPGRPRFQRHEVVADGEAFEFFSRDIIECIKALYGDADFVSDLVFEPERQYADKDETIRIFHDMHTGKWWWEKQKKIERLNKGKKCTIVPVVISSDKTQLTTFRNKTAYPVYMTIGNLPKHIRRKPSRQGQVLLAYLPTSKLSHITNKAGRRRTLINLFHTCMKFIVAPLEKAGNDGLVMISGDGAARRCFPLFANYIGDYPEQVLVSLVKTGDCPICPPPHLCEDDEDLSELAVRPPRDIEPVLAALGKMEDGPRAFVEACTDLAIKAVPNPFWKDLPFVNIYASITPDILHQLYQGLVKHLVTWIRACCTDAEIDARCRRLPPNHNVRLFMKGLSPLSRITGTEHDQICKILLGLVLDIRLPNNMSNVRLIRTVRAALDFVYLAKYPIHTSETLDQLEDALAEFNDNRDIFIDLGVRDHFRIPKLHYIGHYRYFIEQFGTTDNYNTEYTERLHIDLAKDAYRASNSKDEYPQMTAWLERKEKILQHEKYIHRRLEILASGVVSRPKKPLPSLVLHRELYMTQHPTFRAVSLATIRDRYKAPVFEDALSRCIVQYQHPDYTKAQVEAASNQIRFPFYRLPVYHRIKFISRDPYSLDPTKRDVVDSIHIEPESLTEDGNTTLVMPGRFDTVIVNFSGRGKETGVDGYAVAQVKCVFSLPESMVDLWFPNGSPAKHFAYVDWFTPFSKAIYDPNSKLYRITRLLVHGEQQSSVIPISLIRQSVHLFPKFGPTAPNDWKSSNVLDKGRYFYVNPFSDRFPYSTLY